MAESTVILLIEKLGPLVVGGIKDKLVEEIKLPKGVSNEIRWIKDELESMKAFIRDADARAESEAGVKTWVAQIREAAYDIEDVLDEFALHLAQAPVHDDHKVMVFLRKTIHFFKHLKMRCRIAKQMKELRTQVVDISTRAENHRFNRIEPGSSSSNLPSDRVRHLRSTDHFVEDADLVGIDNPRKELIELLVGGKSTLTTISVIGMGGLGKTTLVGKVYSSERVKTHFEAFTWVTVSQTFSIDEIFRSMAEKISEGRIEQADTMGKVELIEMLRSYLQQKRYVIVLDDLWTKDDWDCIKKGLPNGERGSRIMVTTRINEVATACSRTSDHVYNLLPLPFEQGCELLCKKAFQSDLVVCCPTALKPLSEMIVQKCGGLPLAIAAIGSLLSTKAKTPVEWQKLYDSLGQQIESSSSLTSMNQILSLSYTELPYYLKPCFMYVSIFPEDYLIRPMRLIQLWIAEGFVESKEGLTVEEVADDYLHDLISRSLIQVASYTDFGTIKECRVHDVVREIIISKAREEKFVTFPNRTEPSDKTRRLALHSCGEIVPKKLSLLRAFFMFGKNGCPDSLLNTWFSSFTLLKVVDLEGIRIEEFPSKIVNLSHLKFLGLRGTAVRELPESIGKLKNLETLDLFSTGITELPASIVKLKYLRHLLGRVKVSPGLGSLRSLQQLGYIKSDQGNGVIVRELGNLIQLKWLGIFQLTIEDGLGLCASIEKMTCLSSLSASTVNDGKGLLDLKSLSSPPPFLERVHLDGRLVEIPHWIPSLLNLVFLTLESSRLEEDPFSVLQHLSNLKELNLMGAYVGKELCCERRGFQSLKLLSLVVLNGLKLVRLEKGAMPSLRKLYVMSCKILEKVPFGIEHLTNLKELEFNFSLPALGKSIERHGGEDYWKIRHVPVVKFCPVLARRR